MKASYISRHNAAVRMIYKAISKGKHGGHYTIMDAGTAEHMQELGTQGNQLPAWLLPQDVLMDFGKDGVPVLRNKLRPDILIIPATVTNINEQLQRQRLKLATCKRRRLADLKLDLKRQPITIIEVGYCANTRIADKYKEKARQHLLRATMLQSMGYAVEYHSIPLGAAGAIYNTTNEHLHTCGVEQPKSLLHKLHRHAIKTLHNIVVGRRQHESKMPCDCKKQPNPRRHPP